MWCWTTLCGLGNREYGRKDPSRWPRGTLYPQKLALPSLTSSGRSVGIVRSLTQATERSQRDGPPCVSSTAAVLSTDSYKFWRASSSCFIGFGGGNLFPTLSHQNWSEWLSDVQIWWLCWTGKMLSLSSCSSRYQWIVPAVSLGHCRAGNLHRCSEITFGSWDAPDYTNCPRDNGTSRIPRYCCPNHHRNSAVSCFTAGTSHSGLGVLRM
jgi:hypothetical protein